MGADGSVLQAVLDIKFGHKCAAIIYMAIYMVLAGLLAR